METYDPALERRDVAVRMLWKLYHRQNGAKLLEELGLSPEQANTAFADRPYPKTQREVFAAIGRCHSVALAAEEVLRRYIAETRVTRREHYHHQQKGIAA